jgi:biotin carboxylase
VVSAPLVLVVYDRGSVTPRRLARAARTVGCRLVFLTPRPLAAPHEARVLAALGGHVDTTGMDMAQVARIGQDSQACGVITFAEPMLGYTAELADRLGLRHHRPDNLPALVMKSRQREVLRAAGFPTPAWASVRTLADVDHALSQVRFPLLVKPVRGAGSRNTVAVDDRAELDTHLRRAFAGSADTAPEQDLLVEELLVGQPAERPWGDYIAVDCLASEDRVEPLFVTAKFALQHPFRERGGYGPPREDPGVVKEVEELAVAAVRTLGARTGIADVEIKLTPRGPRVIEVNGRLGAWVDDLSTRLGGVDMVATALCSALGQPSHVRMWPEPARAPIAYNYVLVPPPGTRRFTDLGLFSRLRGIPGVTGVEQYKGGDNTNTAWELGAASAVGAVFGLAEDHGGLAAAITRIESEFAAGSRPPADHPDGGTRHQGTPHQGVHPGRGQQDRRGPDIGGDQPDEDHARRVEDDRAEPVVGAHPREQVPGDLVLQSRLPERLRGDEADG